MKAGIFKLDFFNLNRQNSQISKSNFKLLFLFYFRRILHMKTGISQLDFLSESPEHIVKSRKIEQIQESCSGHAKKVCKIIFLQILFSSAGGRAFSCNVMWENPQILSEVSMCYTAQKEGVLMIFCNMYSMQVLMLTCITQALYCNTQRQTWLLLPMLNNMAFKAKCSMGGNH